jgi:hypothetical protein
MSRWRGSRYWRLGRGCRPRRGCRCGNSMLCCFGLGMYGFDSNLAIVIVKFERTSHTSIDSEASKGRS